MGSVADLRAGLPRLSTAPTAPPATAPSLAAPTRAAASPAALAPTAPARLVTGPGAAAAVGSASPDLAAVAGVAGVVLLVAAGFRARARLGRLG